MRPLLSALLVLLAACATDPTSRAPAGPMAILPSAYEPAAQFEPARGGLNEGAVLGAAGGAGVGALSAKASAGLLCTIGGPLCLIVMVPAAIVGGLVGGVAGGVVDALTSDPGNRIANARAAIAQAVADMRLTETLAQKTQSAVADSKLAHRTATLQALAAQGFASALEVGMAELEIVPREKEVALVLRARSRLYRTLDAALLGERVAEKRTSFRKYEDWAAEEARPLREAVDAAIADLAATLARDPGKMGSVPFSSPASAY